MIFLWFLTKLIKNVFGASIITLLMLLIAEDIKKNLVLNYFDLGKLLLFCLMTGIAYLILSKFEEETNQR